MPPSAKVYAASPTHVSTYGTFFARAPYAWSVNDSFDCATTAFTVRNVADVRLAFAELRRVVRPGGQVVCLELSQPRFPLWESIFGLYFGRVVLIFFQRLRRLRN